MAARRRTEDLYVEGLVRFIVIGIPLSLGTDITFLHHMTHVVKSYIYNVYHS